TLRLLGRADRELDPLDRDPKVRELLDDATARLGGWLDGQPDVEAQVRETIGGAFLSLGRFAPAGEQLPKAVPLDARADGPRRPPRPHPPGHAADPHAPTRRGRADDPPQPGRLPHGPRPRRPGHARRRRTTRLGPLAPRPARRGRGRAAPERGGPRPRVQA